jgi:hypothetical protein
MIDSPTTTKFTGLGHYRAAATLLAEVANSHTATATDRAEMIARAQVHATLALAAASILTDGADGLVEPDRTPWRDAVAEATT